MANGIDEIRRLASDLADILKQNKDQIAIEALKQFEADIKERIFTKGIPGTSYSTKKMWAGADAFVKRSAFKPKKNRKTVTLSGGYKELRRKNSRRVNKVDLNYTGTLFQSIQLGTSRGNPVLGLVTAQDERNRGIIAMAEKKYDKDLFRPTDKELREMDKAIERALTAILRRL